MIYIGQAKDFRDLPALIYINNEKFYLIKNHTKYRLVSSICPHQGGAVEFCDEKECFVCPIHQWEFDKNTGKQINSNKMGLKSYEIIENEGALYVNIIRETVDNKVLQKINEYPIIKLHAHACIEVIYNDFHLLCDPWLEGPAFLGAWLQYPPANVGIKDLKPDAIWISHEHSDHFHIPTLEKIDKNIPIYIPAFPNGRMEMELEKLGFKNIYIMPWGEKVNINSSISITTYQPSSLWNDAFVLIEIGSFKFLNLNDAGINHQVAKLVGPVHAIASSFSPGASGYPLTWEHISETQKKAIMTNSRQGILKMLEQAAEIYGATYIFPFASHFTLWKPEHDKYSKQLLRNTVSDVVEYFKDKPYKVIDIFPGGVWNTSTDSVENVTFHSKKEQVLEACKKFASNEQPILEKRLSKEKLIEYFLNLNNIPEMIFCEDLTCSVQTVYDSEVTHTLNFKVQQGVLEIVNKIADVPNITMKIPENILYYIIENNESWDEATIGYWCVFSRNPDVYHADFWRILQAPYYKKSVNLDRITENISIAEILEQKGELAERILGRSGLYCGGCQGSIYETLEQGAIAHGLSTLEINRLVKALNRI